MGKGPFNVQGLKCGMDGLDFKKYGAAYVNQVVSNVNMVLLSEKMFVSYIDVPQ